MAYDEALAQRIRAALPGIPGIIEKKMFGGIAFMVDGNMACGVSKDNLMVRISPDATDAALAQPHVRVFDMTGRPMKGWVLVSASALERNEALVTWIGRGVSHARSLPKKK